MKEESEFILLTFSLVVVGESKLFSIGDLAACGGCASNRQLALTLSPCRPEQIVLLSVLQSARFFVPLGSKKFQ